MFYGAAAPFWYIASRRVKALFLTRFIPLVSVFGAFSFVIMMFNIPIPGGTTAHALGVGIAAIVLGPWASTLAVTTALLIQAVFFGDGGITTFGANSFNMAIVGSLVAYLAYRALAGRAPLSSARRAIAAALAGYVAINAAALCASVELGLQPLLFKSATGAPLYAPYPLRVAVPAIMLAHLTLAGAAELIVTGGVVAYLQRANPALLRLTAPHAPADPGHASSVPHAGAWSGTRPLLGALALLLLLTPLGILAAGTAWGEWGVRDFSNPLARQRIMSASHNVALPARAPRGLAHLSRIWTAPFPSYAPAFVREPAFGYLLSAMFGAGVIILLALLATWAASRRRVISSGADARAEEA